MCLTSEIHMPEICITHTLTYDAFDVHRLQYDMRYPLGTVQKSGCVRNPYLRFDQDCRISLDRVGQPALQAFGKVTNCLCEGARNGTQYFRDEEVHNALIEHVVACTEVLHHRFTSSQKDQFVFWDLFHFIVNWLLDFTGTKHGHSIKLNSRCVSRQNACEGIWEGATCKMMCELS